MVKGKCKICGKEIKECIGTYAGIKEFVVCQGNNYEGTYSGPLFCEKHMSIFLDFMNSLEKLKKNESK